MLRLDLVACRVSIAICNFEPTVLKGLGLTGGVQSPEVFDGNAERMAQDLYAARAALSNRANAVSKRIRPG
jgi:hypothetical protein